MRVINMINNEQVQLLKHMIQGMIEHRGGENYINISDVFAIGYKYGNAIGRKWENSCGGIVYHNLYGKYQDSDELVKINVNVKISNEVGRLAGNVFYKTYIFSEQYGNKLGHCVVKIPNKVNNVILGTIIKTFFTKNKESVWSDVSIKFSVLDNILNVMLSNLPVLKDDNTKYLKYVIVAQLQLCDSYLDFLFRMDLSSQKTFCDMISDIIDEFELENNNECLDKMCEFPDFFISFYKDILPLLKVIVREELEIMEAKLSTNIGWVPKSGTIKHWNRIRAFIENNDLKKEVLG